MSDLLLSSALDGLPDLQSAPELRVAPDEGAPVITDARSVSSLVRPATTAPGAPVELLWHQRQVTLTGVLHQVRVPLIGGSVSQGATAELTSLLSAWWVGRPSLSATVQVTSAVVDVQRSDIGDELVVLVTTSTLAEDHSIVNVRMIRDLRRALRIHRLRAPGLGARAA
ncbi:MAG: hypothetical protein JHD16_06080 [Solirubrobacteraceae bacterium]|nr:hypothetical protein [Solirubrobacteraceae bacterium]